MFTRRVATFVLGMWIGCALLLDLICLQNARFADLLVTNPADGARALMLKIGAENATSLLHHMAGQQARAFLYNWEIAQFVAAAVLILLLLFSDQKKVAPASMGGVMVLLLAVQHFLFTPQMNALGLQADFLAESAAFSVRTQLITMTQIYGVIEALKLAVGGALASYLFVMQSTVVRKRRHSSRSESLESSSAGERF
ncbi:MAG: hypothetical protein ABI811_15280 [Acidobacteriota bacterium]